MVARLYAVDALLATIVSFVVPMDSLVDLTRFVLVLCKVDRRFCAQAAQLLVQVVRQRLPLFLGDPFVKHFTEIRHAFHNDSAGVGADDVPKDTSARGIASQLILPFLNSLPCRPDASRRHTNGLPGSISVLLLGLRNASVSLRFAFEAGLRQILVDACRWPNPDTMVRILHETRAFGDVIPPHLLVALHRTALPSGDPFSMTCAYALVTDPRWKWGARHAEPKPIVPNVLLQSLVRRGHGLTSVGPPCAHTSTPMTDSIDGQGLGGPA